MMRTEPAMAASAILSFKIIDEYDEVNK